MIQKRAVIVNLSIHAWTARAHDKKATKEIETAHTAKDAGRFNKLLVAKEALQSITAIASTVREYHYKHTLPWGDNGQRLLPSSKFMDYRTGLFQLKEAFSANADKFAKDYPQLRNEARARLNTLYNPEDYPEDIRSRFSIDLDISPVPSSGDFRVDVEKEALDEMQAGLQAQVSKRETEAISDCWKRLADVLTKAYERLCDPDAIFRDSLITNLTSAAELIPSLNIFGDKKLNALCAEITLHFGPWTPDAIRSNKVLRADLATKTNTLLRKIPS